MRIAVVSDIHANLPALEALLADLRAHPVDRVVNLGDSLSGPLWPQETADRLRALGWPTLAGNHERQVLTLPRTSMSLTDAQTDAAIDQASREWMRGLPATAWVHAQVYACHGTPDSDLRYLLETVTEDFDAARAQRGIRMASPEEVRARLTTSPGFDPTRLPPVILCGHTHTPRTLWLDGTLLLNPGSLGLPAYDDEHPHTHWVENGSPHARYAVLERTPLGWSVAQRLLAYDWALAARRAESQGRGDWADALASGFVGRTEAQVLAARHDPPSFPR
ncbi:MAG: metallophosphoesterase family protein [Rhizobacter sp.]